MKAVFEWPNDVASKAGLQHIAGFKLHHTRYEQLARSNHTLIIDCTARLITITGPDDRNVPWSKFYQGCIHIIMGRTVMTSTQPAKRWFRKLKVIEHESARADRHPTDAGPRDQYQIIKVGQGEIVHEKRHGYTNKKEYLAVMSQLYDRIQPKLKRPT